MKIEEFNPNVTEIAEEVLLGPQAEIITKINNFNMRYGTVIKSTKTFRWSPGVGEQLKKVYQSYILDWDKKYSGVYHFFNRIDNRMYFHRSMKQSLNQINESMTDFRHRGITFQNNSDLVVETFNCHKNKALEELEAVKQMYSDQDLQIDLQVYERDGGGYYYRYEFAFPNPAMSIDSLDGNGELDHLVDIKLYPIVLSGEIDFIDHLNRTAAGTGRSNANCTIKGKVLAPRDTVYHPYIYSRNQNQEWYTVCLGDMAGDIQNALTNFNIVAASMLLMQWTSQYTVNRTHPHNKPNTTYYGLPKYIKDQENSAAYIAAFPHNPDACGVPAAIQKLFTDSERESSIIMDNTCNGIECELRDKCSYYANVVNASQERIDNIMTLYQDTPFMYARLFRERYDNDKQIEKRVLSILTNEDHCIHGIHYDDACDTCIEEEVQEYESHRAIEDENMTDEERTLNWVQRTIERRRR